MPSWLHLATQSFTIQCLLSFTFCSQTGDTSYHITIEDYPPSQDDEYFFVSCVPPFHTYIHTKLHFTALTLCIWFIRTRKCVEAIVFWVWIYIACLSILHEHFSCPLCPLQLLHAQLIPGYGFISHPPPHTAELVGPLKLPGACSHTCICIECHLMWTHNYLHKHTCISHQQGQPHPQFCYCAFQESLHQLSQLPV